MATIDIIKTNPKFEVTLSLEEAKALQRLLDSRMESIEDDSSRTLDSLSENLNLSLAECRSY